MNNETFAVIGSTGKTGSRVVAKLNELGFSTRGLSRQGETRFDWQDRQTWPAALEGVESAYVTYFPDLAIPQAEHDIRAFVELSVSLGLKHIVLLSGRGEEGARRAEDVVKESGLEWNIVRASWFMQNFSESFMTDGLRSGELVLPQPKAAEPFIDVGDIADVAVAALTRKELRNQLFEVTGPDTLTFTQCVDTIAKESSRDIRFQSAPVDAYLATARADGLPDDIAWLINELFVNVLDGRNEWTTDTVEQVLGRPARSFQQYVESIEPTGVWSASNQ